MSDDILELTSQWESDYSLTIMGAKLDYDDDLEIQVEHDDDVICINLRRPELEQLYAHLGKALGKTVTHDKTAAIKVTISDDEIHAAINRVLDRATFTLAVA